MTEPRQSHILVVDDDDRIRDLLSRFLRARGYRVSAAPHADKALAMLRSLAFDLLILDVMMPGMDGFELTETVRENGDVPILLLTARGEPEDRIRGLSAGADDYLAKPIEAEHLVSSIEHRVERARILRSFMDRDSLTGLLNHTKIKEQLDIEASRAKREDSKLSCAMIDIDYFKSVNDLLHFKRGLSTLSLL